jgi:sortase (surface protein transpeptidase)
VVRASGGGGGGSGSGVNASRLTGPAPVSLSLPSLGVNSAIEQIGLVNNQLDTPHNPYNTGWYYTYDAPGQGGNAVFAAHVDYFPNIKGPFNQLHRMAVGDEVDVATSDGSVYTYAVVSNTRYDASSIPMGAIIWPAKPDNEDRVTLITCGGRFVATQASGAGEYLDRDVVIASRLR